MSSNWPVDRSCLPALPDESDDTYLDKLAAQSAAEDLAVSVLWALSGRQFGLTQVLARPCPTPQRNPWATRGNVSLISSYLPIYEGGRWTNYPCGCTGRCTQAGPRTVHLPGPVHEVVSVTIVDEEMDSDDYVLENDLLYNRTGNWPHQDHNRPLGESKTWSVSYLRGIPVPDGVSVFVGLLAKEFLAACSGDSCRLPRNVVAVTNRGVSKQFDPSRIYAAGKTGLSEIDMWLAAVNPHHIMGGPKVL